MVWLGPRLAGVNLSFSLVSDDGSHSDAQLGGCRSDGASLSSSQAIQGCDYGDEH